jgi:hypothetical protein
MKRESTPDDAPKPSRWDRWDWAVAAFLFLATAAVVVWQNLHVGVLWDLSYILENARRISLGDVPYRDFPFPYAPGTFLIQAALINLGGRVFFHHIIYSALVGGIATVIAWTILTNIFSGSLPSSRLIAFLQALPLVALGIYCVYPHPFYDPDCTFAILVCVYLLQGAERKGWPPLRATLTGAALILPLFIKQNVGLAFLGSVGLVITALMIAAVLHRRRVSGYLWVLAGAALALALAICLIGFTVGLRNYWRWTIQFAAARRTPSAGEMFGSFLVHSLWWWVLVFVAGAMLLWIRSGIGPSRKRWVGGLI